MTTPPGPSPDPGRPADRSNEPPAGWAGSSPSGPAGSPWDQPQGQQPTYQPGHQYPAQQYPAQQYPGGQGQHPAWGQPQGYPQQGGYEQPRMSNGLGIAALVLGLLSIPGAFFGGIPGILLGLLAIVLGIVALRRVKARRADNKGMAITGLVTGIIGLLIGLAVLAFAAFLLDTTAECQAEFERTGDQAAFEQCVQESLGQ